MLSESKKLEKFIEYRSKLINKLDNKNLSKEDFTHENALFINSLELKAFSQIESFEEGLYNYQYFNLLAKEALSNAEFSKKSNNKKREKYYLNQKDNYYTQKDNATIALINICSDEEVIAYYINTNSFSLKGKLFEIYFPKREKCILHSMNEDIRKKLIDKNLFKNEFRDSLINEYVNSKN